MKDCWTLQKEIMHNFPMSLSLNDTPVHTNLRRQRSFTTTSLVKCDDLLCISGKNRRLITLEEEEEEEGIVENNCSSLEDLIRQLQGELQQTRALVSELEARLEMTEQTSQVIYGELKNLLSENESESNTTAVEIEEIDEIQDKGDDMKFDLDDDDFYISSLSMSQSHQEKIERIFDNDERELSSQVELTTNTSTSSTSSLESSIIQHADDTNDSFNRICSALQNLINDGQVALQKPNSSPNQLFSLSQTTTRPRAQSWSSNVSSWIMNQYNPSSMICECGSCWLCLESSTMRSIPKSSRANSISSVQHSCPPLLTSQQLETYNRQINLARIEKQYRKKLESRFDYRKSCDDLEIELQKLISTAISTGIEHGLMHSPAYCQSSTVDSYFTHQDKLENPILDDGHNNNNDSKNASSKWRNRIWNCLQKMGLKFNNDNDSKKDNHNKSIGKQDNDEYNSYNSYNSSWKSSSSQTYQEYLNEDQSNPFPSSFINLLNIEQNIFSSNVNKTTNNFNETVNSFHTTSTTNNYYNCYNTINDHEEKSSQLNFIKDLTIRKSTYQSLASKCTNFLAMIGLMFSMTQTVKSTTSVTSTFMSGSLISIFRRIVKGRRSRDTILMINVIKYITVLFVGWAAGRIGKKQTK